MKTITDPIRLFDGKTSARTFGEALSVQRALCIATGKPYCVTDGPKDWKTGKPLCYTIEPMEVTGGAENGQS